jgi:glycosyltransferase involved in cell wall biosynthesis
MASRKTIVIPYYNTYFTATSLIIYVVNVIKTLKLVEDAIRPELIIWHNGKSPLKEITDIDYPYIKFQNIKTTSFRLKKLLYLMLHKIKLHSILSYNGKYDYLFCASPEAFSSITKKQIYWKADFQENYYPQYFKPNEIDYVKQYFAHVSNLPKALLLFSSNDAKNDFQKFYPGFTNQIYIYRFISHLSSTSNLSFDEIKKRFTIDKPYFIVCNQFWPHKNHRVILEALKLIKEQKADLPFQFVFTGKTTSTRGDEYFKQLVKTIEEFNLVQDIKITDFIEREVQTELMKNCIAFVQPSLFEGWSTVIEDAKALNKYVISSDLRVNIEQIAQNVSFFNPRDAKQLAGLIEEQSQNIQPLKASVYFNEIQRAKQSLIDLFGLS